MSKLIIAVGLPATGKTIAGRKWHDEDIDTRRYLYELGYSEHDRETILRVLSGGERLRYTDRLSPPRDVWVDVLPNDPRGMKAAEDLGTEAKLAGHEFEVREFKYDPALAGTRA